MVKKSFEPLNVYRAPLKLKLSFYGNDTKVFYTAVNESYPALDKMSEIYKTILPNNTNYKATEDVYLSNY